MKNIQQQQNTHTTGEVQQMITVMRKSHTIQNENGK